ncbi:Beta-barrel assembly machine subunit BamD [Sunxiuqinia elliptica]|uniref:Beta-barrel assembly machine subunit BamD n=2 Tax=Sunxiuqinia elliptica TaxID=655355 RepID=A0A1I2M0P7_9BACT|nr:Beta-barrel assembly machine subunit BamD [Sunxiuqinia elliptica]TDO66914.1 Beta-barrel assembly machine subunit BamD [Sunxiuqinia elliptica]SFF82871.1 outer membrane protein assembly factor BamD [Sunxiuqinia elliptica]
MLIKMKNLIVFALFLLVAATSCSDYNKVVKSTDYEFKYKKALEYYEDEEFVRSSQLLSELVNIYRGTSRADEVYYYYAKSHFGMGDYLMAGHWFRTLVKDFPKSQYAEESQYMIGYCFYKESPKPRLDQQVTQKAIDALQLYVNIYPGSDRVEEANRLIIEMRDKLVYKSFLSGRLYYDLENYKAAVVALSNSLKDFPDTQYREELMYMLLRAKYLLAIRSIEEKKEQRLTAALDEYFTFVDEFPESEHRKEVDKFYKETAKLLNYNEEANL